MRSAMLPLLLLFPFSLTVAAENSPSRLVHIDTPPGEYGGAAQTMRLVDGMPWYTDHLALSSINVAKDQTLEIMEPLPWGEIEKRVSPIKLHPTPDAHRSTWSLRHGNTEFKAIAVPYKGPIYCVTVERFENEKRTAAHRIFISIPAKP